MATELLDLPNEILKVIFSSLDIGHQRTRYYPTMTKPNLRALALTCRRISAVSRSLIFRSIGFETRHSHSREWLLNDWVTTYGNHIRLLLRTWREDPTLYLNVLQQVSWCIYLLDDAVRDEFFDCFAKSQSLHELNMLCCYPEDVQRLVARLYPQQHAPKRDSKSEPAGRSSYFTALRILRIHPKQDFFNYTNLMLPLCTAPHLQHLEAGAYGISTMITDKDVEDALRSQSSKSRLESLHISMQSFIEVADLGRILTVLSKSQTLKRLTIPPPAPGIKYDDGRRDRFPETNQRFSPAAIAQALLPISETLETLSITDPDVIYYAVPDNTRLDLSRFTALRALKVSSFILAGGHHLSLHFGAERQKTRLMPPIWQILPPNLEELYVAFDALKGVFHAMITLDCSPKDLFHIVYAGLWEQGPGSPVQVSRALQWVTELVEERKRQSSGGKVMLGKLRRIDLVECHNVKYLQTDRDMNHEIGLKILSLEANHPDVFRRFAEAGIRVDVRIYVPNEWPSLQ